MRVRYIVIFSIYLMVKNSNFILKVFMVGYILLSIVLREVEIEQ